jgi:hypothetical protein
MTTKGNIEWEYWRKHNAKDAGDKPYQGRDRLYQPPAGHTGGVWPQDIRDHYAREERARG